MWVAPRRKTLLTIGIIIKNLQLKRIYDPRKPKCYSQNLVSCSLEQDAGHAHFLRESILRAQGQQLKETGQPFPRGFATQEQHPVAGCIQFIQRHFQ